MNTSDTYVQGYEGEGYKGMDCIDMEEAMDASSRAVYFFLRRNRAKNNRVVMSQKDITKLSGIERTKVSRGLNKLQSLFVIIPLSTTGYMFNPTCYYSGKISERIRYIKQFEKFVNKEKK